MFENCDIMQNYKRLASSNRLRTQRQRHRSSRHWRTIIRRKTLRWIDFRKRIKRTLIEASLTSGLAVFIGLTHYGKQSSPCVNEPLKVSNNVMWPTMHDSWPVCLVSSFFIQQSEQVVKVIWRMAASPTAHETFNCFAAGKPFVKTILTLNDLHIHIALGIRCHWLKRHAETFRQSLACCLFCKIYRFKSLISRKCKCKFPYELYLHIAEGKSLQSVYCTNISVQPLLHSSVLQCLVMGGHPSKVPFPWGDLTPSNTRFLGPTRVFIPNGISIGSAVFAQLTVKCPYTLYNVLPLSPQKLRLPLGICTPI